MKADFHTHTSFSYDSESAPEVMINSAIQKGLKALYITDHHDLDYMEPGWEIEFDSYFETMLALKERYAKEIDIRIGIEFGFQPHLGEAYTQLAQKYPFEFIIGSTHMLDGFDPFYPEYFNMHSDDEGYRRVFEIILENAQNIKCYDVLGHLDYMVRYGHEKEKHYCYLKYADHIDEILRTIIYDGKGLELNTGGWRKGLSFAHPHQDILKRYKELGGEIITIGSDAHLPEDIADHFGDAKAYLEACGFKYYTEFKQRNPIFCAL